MSIQIMICHEMHVNSSLFVDAFRNVLLDQAIIQLGLKAFQHLQKFRFWEISAFEVLQSKHKKSGSIWVIGDEECILMVNSLRHVSFQNHLLRFHCKVLSSIGVNVEHVNIARRIRH